MKKAFLQYGCACAALTSTYKRRSRYNVDKDAFTQEVYLGRSVGLIKYINK